MRAVASYKCKLVLRGGRRNETIHDSNRPSQGGTGRHDFSPRLGDLPVDGQQASIESRYQLVPEPALQAFAAPARRQTLNPELDLRQSNHTEEYVLLLRAAEPSRQPGIGLWLRPFRNRRGENS